MTQQLAPEATTDEVRPRYEPPQVIDLSRMAQAQGGENCAIGSANAAGCVTGVVAVGYCASGTQGNRG